MEKIVICANSYLQYKNVLYVASQNYLQFQITVLVPGNPDLLQFLKLINEKYFSNALTLIDIESFHPDTRRAKANNLRKIIYVLADLIRERNYLKEISVKYLNRIEKCKIYILDRNSMQYYIAMKLGKKNELVYISPYQIQVAPKQCSPGNIVDLARVIIYKLTYGCSIALGRLAHLKDRFPYMSDRFLEREFASVINENERDEMMKGFELRQFKVMDMSRYRVFFLFDVSDYSGNKDAFTQELAGIFDILRKHFPESEIACKYHPGYEGDEISLDMGEELPEFIPAEVLYSDNIRIYFGVCSAALSNVEKGTVISLIDLISFDDETTREKLKETLLQTSRAKILFPKSLDEFEQILVGIRSSGSNN